MIYLKVFEDFDDEIPKEIINIANEFMRSSEYDEADDCKMSTKRFVNWLNDNKKINPDVILLSPPRDINKFPGRSLEGDSHIFVLLGGYGIDFTANQFRGVNGLIKCKNGFCLKITSERHIPSEYKKIGGYFTTSPDYFDNKPYIKDKFENLPKWFHEPNRICPVHGPGAATKI